MSCCGGSRSKLTPSANVGAATRTVPPPAPARPTLVIVRYEGKGTLTGYGSATGRKYRFPPSVEIAVDIRDRLALRGVPNLREIRFA